MALSGQPTGIADGGGRRDLAFARDVAEVTTYVPTALLAVSLVATAAR